MKEDLTFLEKELERLRPHPLSPACIEHLVEVVNHKDPGAGEISDKKCRRLRFGFRGTFRWVLALGAAAVLVAGFGILQVFRDRGERQHPRVAARTTHAEPSAPTDRNRAVSAGTILYGLQDEGTTVTENGRPARKVRLFLVEETQWEDPDDQTKFEVIRPREQVVYVTLPVL